MMIVTIKERKENEARRRRTAIERVERLLAAYAQAHGGTFMVFGSVARNEVRYDSDFDVVADFPRSQIRGAVDYAESICAEHRLKPDVHSIAEVSPDFIDRVRHEWRPVA